LAMAWAQVRPNKGSAWILAPPWIVAGSHHALGAGVVNSSCGVSTDSRFLAQPGRSATAGWEYTSHVADELIVRCSSSS